MRLYSDFFGRRALQVLGDLVAIGFLVGGLVTAWLIHSAIDAFDVIGEGVEASGTGFATTMTDIGGNLAKTPLVGKSIQEPFTNASGAGKHLAEAGIQWQVGVHTTADAVGWTIAGLVVLVVAVAWIAPRLRGASRRRAAARLADSPTSLDLLAMRALATGAPREIADITTDVVGSWRRGDPEVIRQLAALELKSAGIRLKSLSR